MNILRCLPYASMIGEPFADFLNVTTPYDNADAVRESLLPLLETLGAFEETQPGEFTFFDLVVSKGKLTPITDGVFKLRRRSQVLIMSASGGVLRRMRDRGSYAEYLALLSAFPHRVSMLHATADYLVESPPDVIAQVDAAGAAGSLALTRKALLPRQCESYLSTDIDGRRTGTLYLGKRANADVWGKVYDKRHERLSRGFADPGSVVRVEIAVQSDVGATLRDALNPRDIYFNFAGRTLVEVPPDFSGWVAHGEGFVLGERRERTLFERMETLLENSRDVARVGAMAIVLYGDKAAQVIGRKVVERGVSLVDQYRPKPAVLDDAVQAG